MTDRSAKTALKHVALLRGINVGGKNLLPMKDLIQIFVAAGCHDVTTYIQSGNVVFCADKQALPGIGGVIAKHVEERFRLKVPVVVRTAAELTAVTCGNPFLEGENAAERLHVCFLADRPSAALVAGLDAGRSSPDEFEVMGREIYLKLVNGVSGTKLTNAHFDSKLKTVSTIRNWMTVLKLKEMMM